MISKQTGKAIVAYIEYQHSRTVGLKYLSCYVAIILGLLSTIAYIIMTMMYSLGISLVVIVVGSTSIARCIIFGVPRLHIRPCDERPPAMYGHFCLVSSVSVHDRYYCIYKKALKKN